jgi:hypothetical protein
MWKNSLKTGYLFRLELCLLIVLIITILFFSLYPRFEQKFGLKNSSTEPDFILTEMPRTYQSIKKPAPPLPKIYSYSDDIELMEDVEIVKKEEIDSSSVSDSNIVDLLYYENLLPFLGLQEFDSNYYQVQPQPLDQYQEYLNNRLLEIFSNKNSYKSRTNVDDFLTKSMGRDPNMLNINIGSVIEATKKYINSNKKRIITAHNIINTKNHWYILEILWNKKGQSIFELYENESIRKMNTIASLKESMHNLKENGLIFEIEGYERSHYYPIHNPEEMIEIVNRILAQDLSNPQKDILFSFLNFVVLNS